MKNPFFSKKTRVRALLLTTYPGCLVVRVPGLHAWGTGVIFRHEAEILLQATVRFCHLQVKATREKPQKKMSLLVKTAVCPSGVACLFLWYLPALPDMGTVSDYNWEAVEIVTQ